MTCSSSGRYISAVAVALLADEFSLGTSQVLVVLHRVVFTLLSHTPQRSPGADTDIVVSALCVEARP